MPNLRSYKTRNPAKEKKKRSALAAIRAEQKKRQLLLPPGSQAFQDFLSKHGDMFNLTELERYADLPNGTLRHIRTGSRIASPSLYGKLQEKLLPKFCEICFTLQNYSGQMIQREITF
jgi:hypothetical protein